MSTTEGDWNSKEIAVSTTIGVCKELEWWLRPLRQPSAHHTVSLQLDWMVSDLACTHGWMGCSRVATVLIYLSDVDGGVVFSGDGELKRTSHWRFDATKGQVLSISMEQETSGVNTMPQGNMDVRQITKVEYSTK